LPGRSDAERVYIRNSYSGYSEYTKSVCVCGSGQEFLSEQSPVGKYCALTFSRMLQPATALVAWTPRTPPCRLDQLPDELLLHITALTLDPTTKVKKKKWVEREVETHASRTCKVWQLHCEWVYEVHHDCSAEGVRLRHASVEALSKTNLHLNRLLQQVLTSKVYMTEELFLLL
jgi:hypothetical protein